MDICSYSDQKQFLKGYFHFLFDGFFGNYSPVSGFQTILPPECPGLLGADDLPENSSAFIFGSAVLQSQHIKTFFPRIGFPSGIAFYSRSYTFRIRIHWLSGYIRLHGLLAFILFL